MADKTHEFRSKMTKWARENGFNPIYSINHPTENKDRIDFVKEGFVGRLTFEKDLGTEVFSFKHEILSRDKYFLYNITINTQVYLLENLNKINEINHNFRKVILKHNGKTLLEKLKYFFTIKIRVWESRK